MPSPTESRLRVRYAETDQMGVAYHANYLVWMEIGRVDYCRAQGLNYREFERDQKIYLSVVDVHCRYHSPARYDDEVVVRTSIATADPRLVRFHYEMRHEDGRKLATGESTHIFLDHNFKRKRVPNEFMAVFSGK